MSLIPVIICAIAFALGLQVGGKYAARFDWKRSGWGLRDYRDIDPDITARFWQFHFKVGRVCWRVE